MTQAAPTPLSAGSSAEAFDYDQLLVCIHCGLCLSECPTYELLGLEMDSPRGRIYQMRAVAEGRVGITDSFVNHMSSCLACRACETACPAGVQYGQLIETARHEIRKHAPHSLLERFLGWMVYKQLLPFRPRLYALFAGLRLFQISGLQALIRALGLWRLIPGMAQREALTPVVPPLSYRRQVWKTTPASGERRYRVGLHAGCIADFAFSDVNAATIRVLSHNGCEVITPAAQTCCGALHAHDGEREQAQALARSNINAFEQAHVDYIIVNAAGCGAHLREYAHLLREDETWKQRAEDFTARVRDISEFLGDIGIREDFGPVEETITYHDACHLAHGQRVRQQPRDLLAKIPGVTLSPLQDADVCCGSAGIYNVTHPELAGQLLENKIANLRDTGAQTVVMGNAGCLIQIQYGVTQHNLPVRVEHTVLLLDRAYRAGGAYQNA